MPGSVCLLLALPATRGWVQSVDDVAYRLAAAVRNRPTTLVAEAFSLVGSVWVNWPLRVAVALFLLVRRRFRALAAFALAALTSEVLIGGLKNLYDRDRPAGSMIETSGYSFPSGHAIAGAVTAVGIVVVLLPPGRSRLRWEVKLGSSGADGRLPGVPARALALRHGGWRAARRRSGGRLARTALARPPT